MRIYAPKKFTRESPMAESSGLVGSRLLLMGSKVFRARKLPTEIIDKIETAIKNSMAIVVGEAPGACRLCQDYLHSRGYRRVIVGHAKSLRYNAGNWETKKYGENLKERERGTIEDCDSALVIWVDHSGVIAENLEVLKQLGKRTYVYECSTGSDTARAGWLDPARIYDPYYSLNEFYRSRREPDGREKA